MQEDDVTFPLLHPHRGIGKATKFFRQHRQLVEMGGEETTAAIDLMEMLDRRPGYGKTVEGCRATADLVQNDQ